MSRPDFLRECRGGAAGCAAECRYLRDGIIPVGDGEALPLNWVEVRAASGARAESSAVALLSPGLYFVEWSFNIFPAGVFPVRISLEDSSGRVYGLSSTDGGRAPGGALVNAARSLSLSFINRSGGSARLQREGPERRDFAGTVVIFDV